MHGFGLGVEGDPVPAVVDFGAAATAELVERAAEEHVQEAHDDVPEATRGRPGTQQTTLEPPGQTQVGKGSGHLDIL